MTMSDIYVTELREQLDDDNDVTAIRVVLKKDRIWCNTRFHVIWVLTEDGCKASELKLRDSDGDKKSINGIAVELLMTLLTTSMDVLNDRGYDPQIPLNGVESDLNVGEL